MHFIIQMKICQIIISSSFQIYPIISFTNSLPFPLISLLPSFNFPPTSRLLFPLFIFILALFLEYRTNFQMKQRKAKPIAPKRVALLQNQSTPFTYIDKQPSAHTKMSTNYTIHSAAQNASLQAVGKKTKKSNPKSSKDSPSTVNKGLPKSKSSKKLKLNLETQSNKINQTQESYREYCLVDENFVPMTCSEDHKIFEDFLAQTAETSDFNYHQQNLTIAPKQQLRKRAISTIKTHDNTLVAKVQKIEIATSMQTIEKELVSAEINAVPEYSEIGLQYSERCEEKKKSEQAEKIIEKQPIKLEGESLSELFFKLQFSHLADEKSFSSLTSNEKEHFSQLLETLVTKLKVKPQLKPINLNSTPANNPQESYKHPYQQQLEQQALKASYEQLEKLVCLREYHQMNWIQANPGEQQENHVNTSLFSTINFLCHLFCFIEVQYSEEFVYMIQKVYGHTFREKYRRITRRIPLIPDRKFRVIDQAVFLEFINESSSYSNGNEIIHFKAIFDSFNEHLEEYRPFYLGNGEQFPWAMKMFTSMSEYSINEESLQIIFLQAKEKMVEWCSNLCGLIVDSQENKLPPGNPLELKRSQKQEKMMKSWMKEQNFEKDGIELYSTQVLHDVSELIYQQLLQQCAQSCFF